MGGNGPDVDLLGTNSPDGPVSMARVRRSRPLTMQIASRVHESDVAAWGQIHRCGSKAP